MGDLSCERFTQLLGDHVEGVLSADERGAVEAHLLGCPRCRELLEQYARVGDVVRRATDVRMPLGARARLRRVLSRLWHRR